MAYQADIQDGDELSRTVIRSPNADVADEVSAHDAIVVSLPRFLEGSRPPFESPAALLESEYADAFAGLERIAELAPAECLVGVLLETAALPYLYAGVYADLHYQRSIAVRFDDPRPNAHALDAETLSLAFFTRGHDVFSIAKVREAYRYCPACEKTTKDYGGKKHLYHAYGTLQRDVWTAPEVRMDPADSLPEHVIERTADTLSGGRYESMLAISADTFEPFARAVGRDRDPAVDDAFVPLGAGDVDGERASVDSDDDEGTGFGSDDGGAGFGSDDEGTGFGSDDEGTASDSGDGGIGSASDEHVIVPGDGRLHGGDCCDLLRRVPDESVDLVFLDPPYNIGKEYGEYDDERDGREYDDWSREWLAECVRVLKPGGVLVSLNVPENAYTHYCALGQHLDLVNWITWDSMSRPPAGNVMPTNYPILVFAKGTPTSFAYERLSTVDDDWLLDPERAFRREYVYPLDDAYCKRRSCIENREERGELARKELTDLWTDVYRLKHTTKREDHPTMLPPKLVRRLCWLFTDEGDVVLDPFNGVGTTTLTAAQLRRAYTGFELSERYLEIARKKHEQLDAGVDPFDVSAERVAPPDTDDTTYEIPKKDLQLDVKRIANALGHVPTPEEVDEHSRYPMRYFEEYFDTWSDVTKAAKTTGMTETKDEKTQGTP